MKFNRDYQDGTVDLANSAILSESLIKRIDHPYIAFVAEKVGKVTLAALGKFAYLRPSVFVSNRQEAEIARPVDSLPRTQRIAGGIVMSAGLALGAINWAPEIVDSAQKAAEIAGGFVQDNVTDPLTRLGRF